MYMHVRVRISVRHESFQAHDKVKRKQKTAVSSSPHLFINYLDIQCALVIDLTLKVMYDYNEQQQQEQTNAVLCAVDSLIIK